MKTVVAVMLIISAMIYPRFIFADECMEGDCENGSGKGFTDDGENL